MTRRKMLLMTAAATVLGLAALAGFADHNAIFAGDDEDKAQEALIKVLDAAKIMVPMMTMKTQTIMPRSQ